MRAKTFKHNGGSAKGYMVNGETVWPMPGRGTCPLGTRGRTGHGRELLTVAEFCAEFKVARSTFYDWLAKGVAPRVRKLPNGQLRLDRRDIDTWFDGQEVAA